MTAARTALVAVAIAAAAGGVACGKKGPPLAPFVRIPAAVDKIAAVRLGHQVYVTLTVPAANIDTSLPVDIGRVDIYGYTGRVPPTPARWAELGTVVGSVPVPPPPPLGDDAPPSPPNVPPTGALPGTSVTILDTLTAEELTQGRLPIEPRRADPVRLPIPDASPLALKRFYMAVPFSQRGQNGPPGAQAEIPLTALPDAPSAVRASYNALTVSLTWEPSGGLIGYLLDKSLPPEPMPFDSLQPSPTVAQSPDAGVPPGPTTYNVYRELAPDPLALPALPAAPRWTTPPPAAMNPAPLADTSATDLVEFGRERCYRVRALRGATTSEASPSTCVTPIDVFPPAAPAGLAAVPSEGGISLIWEPNSEMDLAGYLVLRREPGDATLRQLTATPIAEPRYRDTAVRPGARYSYSIVAVDAQLPLPNISAESEPVEETAR